MTYDKEAWRASHENGRIALAELDRIDPLFFDTDLGGAAMMQPDAAAAMSAMVVAATAAGRPFRIIYSYRTFAVQEIKWANYLAGGNLAAQPGTSNHGWAVACDLGGLSSSVLSWLRSNARRFGYVNDVPSEDWHWTFTEGLWDGDVGGEDDVKFEKFVDAQQKCLRRFKDRAAEGKDPDPGPPPDGMDDPNAVAGWNLMRAALNNPASPKG